MPAIPSVLSALIQSKVDSKMAAIRGIHPLQQRNPTYYLEMCTAIGTGIITGGPTIQFTTEDTGQQGSPSVTGTGNGTGIVVDSDFFTQDLYIRARSYIIEDFGKTTHDAYPPRIGNSGQFLLALCAGISESVKEHYATAWILTSTHPQIYLGTGVINNGHFSGLIATTIKSDIVNGASNFVGRYWPRLAQAISESYVATIQQHSTGTVTITGVCIPSDNQACGIGGTGTGTGVAS